MKNIYLILLNFLIIGCISNPINRPESLNIQCPNILFSSEHKVYIGSSSDKITLDNIEYTAVINNAQFTEKCQIKDNIFISELSLLFIANSLANDKDNINLPYYIALLDENNKIIDIQYYMVEDKFKIIDANNKLNETEIKTTVLVELDKVNTNSIILIGFVIDEIKRDILN